MSSASGALPCRSLRSTSQPVPSRADGRGEPRHGQAQSRAAFCTGWTSGRVRGTVGAIMSGEFEELRRVVVSSLSQKDDELADVVTAVAGLLVTIAYADRDHSAAESAEIARQLERIPGLGA